MYMNNKHINVFQGITCLQLRYIFSVESAIAFDALKTNWYIMRLTVQLRFFCFLC